MRLSSKSLEKLSNIKIVLFDLNGVLIKTSDLNEMCNADFDFCFGRLVHFFSTRGIKLGVITANTDAKVKKEFEKYEIELETASINKLELAQKILKRNNLALENLLYVGDEIFDLQLMKKAGFSIAPSTASRSVKRVADYVSDAPAGAELMDDVESLFLLLEENLTEKGN